ncbi:MAG: hypothetical protein ACRDBG_20095, partial [Waterburya sp.]
SNSPSSDYNFSKLAEPIHRELVSPTGKLSQVNDYILTKMALASSQGQNPVTGLSTPWELACLYSQTPNCPAESNQIDAATLRRKFGEFFYKNPHCVNGVTLIGGYAFQALADEADELCCSDKGYNSGVSAAKVFGYFDNVIMDDYIDTKFGSNSFFLVENNSLALFWLALYEGEGLALRPKDIQNVRTSGVLNVPFRNCRNPQGTTLKFDMRGVTKMPTAENCNDEIEYTVKLRAQYGVFTKPNLSCDTPHTGIYQGVLTSICPPVVNIDVQL